MNKKLSKRIEKLTAEANFLFKKIYNLDLFALHGFNLDRKQVTELNGYKSRLDTVQGKLFEIHFAI